MPFANEWSQVDVDSAMHTESPPLKKKNFRTIILLVVTILILGGLGLYFHFGRSQDIEDVKDSVVMVEVYDGNGELFATGSGFCAFEEDWIVTNFHVIEGAKSIKIITDSRQELNVINVRFFNKEQDLAIVQTNGSLSPLKIGAEKDIAIKDSITTIGSPKGELNTVSEGIISNTDDKNQIRITAPISHGSSGGVLLNEKNEVIGITSAGYDDAQNLNFAINISALENLYAKYTAKDTTPITDVSQYVGTLTDFNNYLNADYKCYTIDSLSTFHQLTDTKARFESLLSNENYSWFSVYDNLSHSNQNKVVGLFIELNDRTFSDNNIDSDIQGWNTTDFFISLGVLNCYEYAIAAVDVSNYTDKDALFDNVNDNYPLGAAEKSLILYLLGNYDWSDLHTDNKEDIFDYFDAKYSETRELGAILETLGYDVVYEDDGTLTGYW